jgi:SAM-dependent methyltransferase
MAERVDFSKNAPVFDRRHGSALADDEVDRLWKAAGLYSGVAILDIGAGTGRVAIPLGIRGCAVVALEPAWGMVDQLRAKANDSTLSVVVGEGGQLPFQAGAFDAVVIARLLYLAKDWREILRESHRVLVAGGSVLHEWGNGQVEEEWVQIREAARRLFERAGVSDPFHPGVRSESDVDTDLTNLGFVRASNVVAGPGPTITLREFLRRLVEGEFSYTWEVPKNVLVECLPKLQAWAEETFDLDRSIAMPREIRWAIYQEDAA